MANTRYLINPGILPALRPSVPALGVAVLSAALAGLTGLAAIGGTVQAVTAPTVAGVTWTCAAWLVAAVFSAFASWLAHAAEARFEARLRREIGAQLLRLPADRLNEYPADHLRRLVADDVATLHHMIAHLPGEIATLVVVPLAATGLLLLLAGPLALLALVPGVLAAIAYLTVIPTLSAKYGSERARVMGEITSAVDDYARGIRVFRSFGVTQGALADYRDATRRFTDDMVAWVQRVATPAAVAVALLQAAASYAIAYSVASEKGTATLAATLFFSLALVTPALRLGHGLDYVTAGRAAAERIGSLLLEPVLTRGTGEVSAEQGGVTVRALSVRSGDRLVLDRLDLDIPAASISTITGHSGAGKSTLLRVLAGLQRPSRGSVRICGAELGGLSEQACSRAVLLVPQSLAVLSATVRENLLLIDPLADDHACRRALGRAQLKVSLDADASLLSGGERQRVALARAFLSSARVILLDEPTSALDDAIAGRVWHEFAQLAHEEDRTVVVVTHDISLAGRADSHCTITTTPRLEEGSTE